MNMNDYGK
jgi:hypothetical protein